MNDIKIFENEKFGSVRVIKQNDEPWFVGKDVATILGYAKPQNAIATHVDEDDKTTALIQGTGSNYKSSAVIVNESGLYSLILSSKLPTAKEFKRWVTAEVLPSIRKTGGYVNDNDLFIETYLPFADEATKLLFRSTLDVVKAQNKMIKEKDEQLQIQAPKVEFADKVSNTEGLISIGDMSKILKEEHIDIGRNKLFKLLRNSKILMSNNVPYQRYVNGGYFKVRESIANVEGKNKVVLTTYVTGKGQMYLVERVKNLSK